jgi:hypothetical protein
MHFVCTNLANYSEVKTHIERGGNAPGTASAKVPFSASSIG